MRRIRYGLLAGLALAFVVYVPGSGKDKPAASKAGAVKPASNTPSPFDDLMQQLQGQGQEPSRYSIVQAAFETEDDAKALESNPPKDAAVFHRVGRFADIFIKSPTYQHRGTDAQFNDELKQSQETINAIVGAQGFVRLEVGDMIKVPPPVQIQPDESQSRAEPEKIVRGGIGDLKGKGVIIAVVDTGLDFHHPDFITYDADHKPTSRLLYFWDTVSNAWSKNQLGKAAPLKYPNGTPAGTIYTQDELTQELRSSAPQILNWDPEGHGTACAGVATGNGNARHEYTGVAPEADIIGVRISDPRKGLLTSQLLPAICQWLDLVATEQKKPLVVSCSFGGPGSFDGQRIEELELNETYPMTAVGRAICIAAGNDGMIHEHAEATLGSDPTKLSWWADGVSLFKLYVTAEDKADLKIDSKVPLRNPRQGNYTAKTIADALHLNALTKTWETSLQIGPGAGVLTLASVSGNPIKVDAYVVGARGTWTEFDPSCATPGKQIQSPGAAANAITVGSYDWNDQFDRYGVKRWYGAQELARDEKGFIQRGTFKDFDMGGLSAYSNWGPLRTGDVTKPDIVAPGEYYAACAPMNAPVKHDSSGRYQFHDGTSAATPYVAGVVALIMQKKPDITLGQVKELLQKYATSDDHTGNLPNPRWGNGKLDYQAVEKMLDNLP